MALHISVGLAATGAWVGCSDDAGPDAAAGAPDAATPEVVPLDAGADAIPGRNCAADEQPDGLMQHLECAGLYDDFAAKTVAGTNVPYTPGVEFWSDDAVKQRWLYLPPSTTIDISSFDAWKFPNGTRVWKEFKIAGKRIETRLYAKSAAGAWHFTTYRWTDDESDAVRTEAGALLPLAGRPAYEIPNTNQCSYCHDNRSDQLLGIDAIGLGLPTAKGITLASLLAEGRFSATPPATQLTIPEDGTGKAAAALGFLHANCGVCHTPDGFAGDTGLHMRILPSQLLFDGGAPVATQLPAYKTGVCQTAMRAHPDGGVAPILRIKGGDPANSLISILSGQRAPEGTDPNQDVQMPPLVTRMVDVQGHKLLTDWISALPVCP